MAGVNVEGHKGGRKQLDSEINMIPMIDLLMVTVSFLLLTAVWSQMGRVDASAQVPGPPQVVTDDPPKPERKIHVTFQGDEPFKVSIKEGEAVVDSFDVPRTAVHTGKKEAGMDQYPALTEALRKRFDASGVHKAPADQEMDVLVLHADDQSRYAEVVAVMDSIAAVTKKDRAGHDVAAYRVSFAVR
jgi:biopolymer transport protein ExbD